MNLKSYKTDILTYIRLKILSTISSEQVSEMDKLISANTLLGKEMMTQAQGPSYSPVNLEVIVRRETRLSISKTNIKRTKMP